MDASAFPLPGSVVFGLRPNSNSWGDGIRSSRGVVRYVDNAVSGHSFPPSAFSNSNWEVPIALSFRLLASWWTGELQHSVLPLSLHLIFFFRSEVGHDSGWSAVFCQDPCTVVAHGVHGHVVDESYHREA